MNKKDYLLLDSYDYLDYFFAELKDRYVPIVCDAYVESFLKSKDIYCIGIFDYLLSNEINAYTQEASVVTDKIIANLDEENRELFYEIFGRKDVNFFNSCMYYLFKRFIIGSTRLIKGLEGIAQHVDIEELAYLHDGRPVFICGNRQQNSFFFPDNISWELLRCWVYAKKPRLSLIKADENKIDITDNRNAGLLSKFSGGIKKGLKNVRDFRKNLSRSMPPYAPDKKNLLFMAPLYDLEFVLSSNELKDKYNMIIWDIDECISPNFLKRQPQNQFFSNGIKQSMAGEYEVRDFFKKFKLDIKKLNNSTEVNIDLNPFITPLIRKFLEVKLHKIMNYWNTAKNLHNTTKIEMLFWGNPPHRFPGGIVREFFRLNKIPVFGMQHGGIYGSNYMGRSIFDLDLNNCDNYFSYGFAADSLKDTYPDEKNFPTVIPVGSVSVVNFKRKYDAAKNKKKKIKVLYPIGVTFNNIFFAAEFTIPRLHDFQKNIIDKLAVFRKFKIVLKFLYGSYNSHYLKPYIEKLYPGRFIIIDNIAFQKSLKIYKPELILIEQQSTPLNEALITKSNIMVYNDNVFIKLTEEAAKKLQKRAVICNTKESFLEKIEDFMNDKIETKDLENREFLEKYCVYNESPEKNIINVIKEHNGKAH